MKKVLFYFTALVMGLALNTSCILSDNGEGEPDYVVSYGCLIDDGGVGYRNCIVTDSGLHMIIYESNVAQEAINNQKERVLANYTILSGPDEYGDYYIRLNAFYNLLTDEIIPSKHLTEEQKKNLGDDPINVTSATISAGYLNMPMIALYGENNKETAHKLQLVYNMEESTEHKYVFDLYHNAYTDKNGTLAVGMYSSFPIKHIIPQGDPDKSYDVEVRWRWYQGASVGNCGVTGIYSPGNKAIVQLTGTYGSQM